jgi:hypothetical protein
MCTTEKSRSQNCDLSPSVSPTNPENFNDIPESKTKQNFFWKLKFEKKRLLRSTTREKYLMKKIEQWELKESKSTWNDTIWEVVYI